MAIEARRSKSAADCFVGNSIFSATSLTNSDLVIFLAVAVFLAGAALDFVATGVAAFFAGAFFAAMESSRSNWLVDHERFAETLFAGAFFAAVFFAKTAVSSFGGET
jgi:hypothetical protein